MNETPNRATCEVCKEVGRAFGVVITSGRMSYGICCSCTRKAGAAAFKNAKANPRPFRSVSF